MGAIVGNRVGRCSLYDRYTGGVKCAGVFNGFRSRFSKLLKDFFNGDLPTEARTAHYSFYKDSCSSVTGSNRMNYTGYCRVFNSRLLPSVEEVRNGAARYNGGDHFNAGGTRGDTRVAGGSGVGTLGGRLSGTISRRGFRRTTRLESRVGRVRTWL